MAELSAEGIIIIIILGTVGMLLLIGGIASFILVYQKRLLHEQRKQVLMEIEYQDEMIRKQLESQEQERNRIGADLHDSLGSLLWGAKVNAVFIQRMVDLRGEVKNSYEELNHILDESIETIRRISWELTPEAFHHSGFSQSIKKLCGQLDGKGMEVKFIEIGNKEWHDNDAMQAFRIVQELVSNALKHSQANILSVTIVWNENDLRIMVEDDGIGFKLNNVREGVGWWNIEQRAKRLHANIQIGDSPMERGTLITIKIPLKNGKEKD